MIIQYSTKFKKFGPYREVFQKLLTEQDGKCAICGTETEKLVLDHDHSTDWVRGLLCSACNMGLGFFSDDKDRLRSAISYLWDHKSIYNGLMSEVNRKGHAKSKKNKTWRPDA
jgi:hypothetical protein